MRSWLLGLVAMISGSALAGSGTSPLAIGNARIDVPPGWVVVSRSADRQVLQSSDKRQEATISLMEFGVAPGPAEFERLCALRIEAERKFGAVVFPAKPPFMEDGRWGYFYSGGDKAQGRVFSGFLSLSGRQLITIYVDGRGIDPKLHVASFSAWVEAMHWTP